MKQNKEQELTVSWSGLLGLKWTSFRFSTIVLRFVYLTVLMDGKFQKAGLNKILL